MTNAPSTHTHTHTNKKTHSGHHLHYITRNPWSRRQGGRDNKSPAPPKVTGAFPFVQHISSFVPFSSQILPTGSVSKHVARHRGVLLYFCILTCFLIQRFLPENPNWFVYLSCLSDSLVSVFPSLPTRVLYCSQQLQNF